MRTVIGDRARDIPIDATNLADYGVRPFDGYEDFPEVVLPAGRNRLEYSRASSRRMRRQVVG